MIRTVWIALCLFGSVLFSLPAASQVSQPGTPWSFDVKSHVAPPLENVPSPDLAVLAEEDRTSSGFFRYAKLVTVNRGIENAGQWDQLPDGRRIWRLGIRMEGAKALSVYFDHFHMPAGGKLYLYRPDRKQVLGAYTEINNHESEILATQLLYGEELILEYNENAESYGQVRFNIGSIGFAYRGVKDPFFAPKDFGDSESCEVNVNCSPEGDNWQDQKRGVVRVSVVESGSSGWCSGSLINNTDEDCKPYILTADHCGGGATVTEFNQWVFYFNFESPDCSTPASGASLDNQTLSGCSKKARGGTGGTTGSDFLLVLCNGSIPDSYEPFYNGWNRAETPSASGVSIHHPAGDIKKISAFSAPPTTVGWNGSGLNSHWSVNWVATANGHGVTEGGSSGSPLFDQNGRIVGDLTGGGSYCTAPNAPDSYGKFSYSWTTNGTTNDAQLKPWLDPGNTGVLTLDGKNSCTSGGLFANFSATPLTVVAGSGVTFTDLSSGSPTTWHWTFDGGTPAASYLQNPPTIVYNTPGTYNATLQVTAGPYSDDKIRVITVIPPGPPTSDFVATLTTVEVGDPVSFLDLTTGGPTQWNWTFVGGTPPTSTDQNPVGITYGSPGVYAVSLYTSNSYGNDTETKQAYITVIPQIPDIWFCDTTTNMLPFDSLMVAPVDPFGYLPGHNYFQITEYADHFVNAEGYDKLTGMIVPVILSNSNYGDAKVRFSVWDGGGSQPGTQLGYKDIKINELYPNFSKLVTFDPPVQLSGDYYVGYQLFYYIGDNYAGPNNFAAGISKDRGTGGASTLFVKYSGQWKPVDSLSNFANIHTSMSIDPIVCNASASNEPLYPEGLNVFPNPSNGRVVVSCDGGAIGNPTIQVHDLMGKNLVLPIHLVGRESLELDFSAAEPGIYFINLTLQGKTYSRKISIIR